MNKPRIHIITFISFGLLASCTASNIEVTPTLQQPTTLHQPSEIQHPTKDEAKKALLDLVKSNPNVFPDFVFKDTKDPSTLNIYYEKARTDLLGYVTVHLYERTYSIWEPMNFDKRDNLGPGDLIFDYFWKGSFIETTYGWVATMPVIWDVESTITK